MEIFIRVCFVFSFLSGVVYMVQSMFVLHTFEIQSGKRPPTVQWWPFDEEMKAAYPGQSKLGRILFISIIVFALPLVVGWVYKWA